MTGLMDSWVSIHIRHCWRMNFEFAAGIEQLATVSIHIRHCWRMNFAAFVSASKSGLFQSTFAIAGE